MKWEGQGLIRPTLWRRKPGLWGRKLFVQSTQLASLWIWPQIQVCAFSPPSSYHALGFSYNWKWRNFILSFQEGFSSWHNSKLLKSMSRISMDRGVQGRRRLIYQSLWMIMWWLYPHNFKAKTGEASCVVSSVIWCHARQSYIIKR